MRRDELLLTGDIICLTETWLRSDCVSENLQIHGFNLHLNSGGVGKGIATYHKPFIASPNAQHIKKQKVQMTKISTPEVDIINIYRSQGADSSELIQDLRLIINQATPTIICGDLNLCFINERRNEITKMLEGQGFNQLVVEASHLQGGHIDHVYSNLNPNVFKVDVMLYSPYYTSRDHDAFFITIMHAADKN